MLTPELRQVVAEVAKASRKNDYLRGPIHEIHNLCRDKLSSDERATLLRGFYSNINIQAICAGCPGMSPVTYKSLATINADLALKLEEFCTNLWKHVRGLKPVTNVVGTLPEHFKQFRHINKTSICPYCGISRIEGVFSDVQEDYDHYLPKSVYPFNAVTMSNLAPICDKCNKKYKGQKDPLHDQQGKRRKAFFSYSSLPSQIKIRMSLIHGGGPTIDPLNLQPTEIAIVLEAPGRTEEVEGWKELFGIETRYKDICCEGSAEGAGGRYWLELVLGEMKFEGFQPAQALAKVRRSAAVSKMAELNFLKVPFLDACDAAGFIR